jgi:hypothetical protein
VSGSLHDGFSSLAYEPVAQHFRGFRAFAIDDSDGAVDPLAVRYGGPTFGNWKISRGALRGIYKREYRWGAGINDAVCLLPPQAFQMRPDGTVKVEPHAVVHPACDCGFWAYTNGEHYLSVGQPACLGIIEGWGRMVIGPDGFRAQHARIVALCFPKPDPPEDETTTAQDVQAYVRPLSLLGSLITMLNDALDAFGAALARFTGSTPPPPPSAGVSTRGMHQPWWDVDEDLRSAVCAMYPHVPVFDTVADMQAAFPLSDLSGLLGGMEDDTA